MDLRSNTVYKYSLNGTQIYCEVHNFFILGNLRSSAFQNKKNKFDLIDSHKIDEDCQYLAI